MASREGSTPASRSSPAPAPAKRPNARPALALLVQAPGLDKTAKAHEKAQKVEKATKAEQLRSKLVRDSFTIAGDEYAALAELKQRAARLERPINKSEILRAAIAALRDRRRPVPLGAR